MGIIFKNEFKYRADRIPLNYIFENKNFNKIANQGVIREMISFFRSWVIKVGMIIYLKKT